MHQAGRILIVVLNPRQRTSTYVRGRLGSFFQEKKSAATAAASAVGHTRPGSASLYARLVGLTLGPFNSVLDLLRVSWFPTRKSASFENESPTPDQKQELLVEGATTATAVLRHLRQGFSCFSVP